MFAQMKNVYYDNNTTLKYEIINQNSDKEFVIKKYYEDGNLEYIEPYKNGKRDGLKTIYYKNGNVKYNIPFTNGKIRGYVKAFNEDGNIKYISNVNNNTFDGITKTYINNSHRAIIDYYKDGKLIANCDSSIDCNNLNDYIGNIESKRIKLINN